LEIEFGNTLYFPLFRIKDPYIFSIIYEVFKDFENVIPPFHYFITKVFCETIKKANDLGANKLSLK